MYGWGGFWRRSWAPAAPGGYRYIGLCRCGTGPHAFFMDPRGRIVHASALWGSPFSAGDIEAELRALQEEKARLEEKIQELEELRKKGTRS